MSDYEESEGVSPTPAGFYSPLNQHGPSIISLTNPEQEIYKLELTLRGATLDENGQPKRGADGKIITSPLLNEKGINSVLGIVQSIVNQVTVFGNLTKEECFGLRDFLADTLARDLMINRINYDIRDISARNKIFFSALSYAVVTMSRGREGDEKRFLSKTTQEIRSSVDTGGAPQKRGLLPTILGWGK